MAVQKKRVQAKKAASGAAQPRSLAKVASGKGIAANKGASRAISAYVKDKNAAFQAVTNELRSLIREAVPASSESVNPWGVPTFEFFGPFCLMMVGKDHVTLGFSRGTSLFDPGRLLEGTGKNLRHVKLRTTEQVRDPKLRKLVLDAAKINKQNPLSSSMRSGKS